MRKLLIVILLLILSGCNRLSSETVLGVSNDTDAQKPRVLVEKRSPTTTPEVTTTPQADVTIYLENLRFLPDTVRIPKGKQVTVLVKNRQGEHSLVIPELGINTGKLSSGEEKMIVLEATQSGTFEMYCDVGNHHRLGMSGQLHVETVD